MSTILHLIPNEKVPKQPVLEKSDPSFDYFTAPTTILEAIFYQTHVAKHRPSANKLLNAYARNITYDTIPEVFCLTAEENDLLTPWCDEVVDLVGAARHACYVASQQ